MPHASAAAEAWPRSALEFEVQLQDLVRFGPGACKKDDICAVGQTLAAHDLCSSLRSDRKRHHMQAGVGHYGVFSGRTSQNQIYPMVKNVILQSD